MVFNGRVMPMILQISANGGVLRTKPCVQQMLLKEFHSQWLPAQKKFILCLKKKKKEGMKTRRHSIEQAFS